jgi:4-amino-4-deoxy-L-arabinose transferase-like glycosyltransferase
MTIDASRARRLVAAAAAAGLALRLAFAFGYWVDKPLTHDEREYLELAHSLAGGRGFTYDPSFDTGTAPRYGRAPVYPAFLAAIGAGGGGAAHTPARVKIAQSIVGAAGVWIVGIIALGAAGPRAGVAAAAIAAAYPPLVVLPAYVFSETLYSTIALGSALLLDRAVDADRPRHALASGLAAGVAILTRPAMLFFLPLAAAWLVWRSRARLAAVLVAAALAVVAPWTIRNAAVYHRFVPVATEGGVTFWIGNHPLARGEGDLAANPGIKQADLEFRRAHPDLTAEQLEPLYYRAAFRQIAGHPLWWAGLLARKAFHTVVPAGPSYALHSTAYIAVSVVPYLLLLLPAAAGARALGRSQRRPVALLLLAASAALVCVVFFPQERFRTPVIDPALIVCASAGWAARVKIR